MRRDYGTALTIPCGKLHHTDVRSRITQGGRDIARRITLMAVGVVGVFLAGISQLRSQEAEAIPMAPISESTTTVVVPSGTDRRTELEESYQQVMGAQLKLMQQQAKRMTDKELEDAIQQGQRAVDDATAEGALQTAVREFVSKLDSIADEYPQTFSAEKALVIRNVAMAQAARSRDSATVAPSEPTPASFPFESGTRSPPRGDVNVDEY